MEITEFKERSNTHQTHMCDLVLLGQDGLEELNDKIDKSISDLQGGQAQLNTTTKIDGSPAVICWSKFEGYPDNSICLKSFVSSNKNAISSLEDIEAKYGGRPDMAKKLQYCLELAPSIPSGEAWQGDCLFSKGDLKEKEIDGTNYLTFQPNTIIYAFSEDNPAYETIKNSDFGICFHTIYKDAGEGRKTQSFRVDAKRLTNVPDNIYVMSPALGKVNKDKFNLDEINKQYEELKQVEQQLLSNSDYEDLCDNSVFMSYWNTFENANLSDKQAVNLNIDTFFDELTTYIKNKQEKEYNNKVAKLKTDAGKQKAHDKYEADVIELEDICTSNREVLVLLVKALNLAANIKMNLWNGYKQAEQGYKTFYKSKSKGYIPANMEGVAMSDQDGNIVKIVDRSTFSFANRSDDIERGWEHNEGLEEDVIEEQAMTRRDALNRCMDLSSQFIQHFDKIYTNPNSRDAEHWSKEMQTWLNQVNNIKLKETNKLLGVDKKMDWFLTGGSDSETIFGAGEEAETYDNFIESLIKDWDIVNALNSVNLNRFSESLEDPDWVKNTVNKVQNSDKDPSVIATKEYHKMKLKRPPKGAVIGTLGEALGKATPYMLRNDGKLIKCYQYHPYIADVYADKESDLISLVKERLPELYWFYTNTRNSSTKNLIEIIYNTMLNNHQAWKNPEYTFEVKDTYVAGPDEIYSFLQALSDETNQEFCRVRTSDLKYGGNSNDIYFRISSIGFN